MKTFVTFGQEHVHNINGQIFDKDCVAIVNGNRKDVFNLFGSKFCFTYSETDWNSDDIIYYTRGYIEAKMKEKKNKGEKNGK